MKLLHKLKKKKPWSRFWFRSRLIWEGASIAKSIIAVPMDHSHVNIRLCVKYGGVRSVCMETKALPWTTGVEPLVKRPSLPTPWEDRDPSSHPLAVLPLYSLHLLSSLYPGRFRFHAVIRIISKVFAEICTTKDRRLYVPGRSYQRLGWCSILQLSCPIGNQLMYHISRVLNTWFHGKFLST